MESSKRTNRKRKLVQDSSYEDDWNQPSAKRSTNSNTAQMCFDDPQSTDENNSFAIIEWKTLTGEASIWPFLTIRGPYYHIFSHLGNTVIQNQPFCKLLHDIALSIYKNALRFRDEDIPKLIRRTKHIKIDNIIDIVEEMCRKLFHFEVRNGLSVDFYEEGQAKCLGSLFSKKTLKIEFDAAQGVVERLKYLSKNFEVTPEQFSQARNAIVRYCFKLSLDLILWITDLDASTKPIKILIKSVVKDPFICDVEDANSQFNLLRMSARLEEVSTLLMERNNHKSSLWVSILFEDPKNYLGLMFGYGLIEVFSVRAKKYFRNYLMNLMRRITHFHCNSSLRKTIEKIMSQCHNERMSLGDTRVRKVLVEIGKHFLNTKKAEFFNEQWLDYTLNLVGTMRGEAFEEDLDCEELVERIHKMTKPSVLQLINSFFPKSDDAMVSHVLVHVFRFVMCFFLNTIRHVFNFDPNTFKVYYDGKFEGDEEEIYEGKFDKKEHKSVSESGNYRNTQKANNGSLLEETTEAMNRCFDFEEQLEKPESIQQSELHYQNPAQDPQVAHSQFEWLSVSARLNEVSTSLMERNDYKSSLWVSIRDLEPCHILEFVFGNGLIQVLPQEAKEYFKRWLSVIRSRMISLLKNGSLKRTIEKDIAGGHNEKLSLGDDRVQKFLFKIGRKTMNTKTFDVFNRPWQDFTLNLIETMRGEAFQRDLDCQALAERIRNMTPSSVLHRINSFFPNSAAEPTMVSHVLINLLRFIVCFILNTIRHVFHFDPNTFTVYYDRKFECDEEKDAEIQREYDQGSYETMPESKSDRHSGKPPEDPVQVRHQFTLPGRNTFSNPCSSTKNAPVAQTENSTDFDEDVPLKWQKAYKLLVEWNQELETEFKRIQETLSQFK